MKKYILFFAKLFLLLPILFFNISKAQGTLYQQGFEGVHGWTFSNGLQANQWRVGIATYWTGANSMYISNNNGASNTYTLNSASIVQTYKDIAMPSPSLSSPYFQPSRYSLI